MYHEADASIGFSFVYVPVVHLHAKCMQAVSFWLPRVRLTDQMICSNIVLGLPISGDSDESLCAEHATIHSNGDIQIGVVLSVTLPGYFNPSLSIVHQ